MSTPDLTPQQRLALSRRAIVRHMHRNDEPRHDEHAEPYIGDDAYDDRPYAGRSKWQLIKHTLRAWWQHHPAHIAVEMGRPMLHRYAEDRPGKLLGIAAVAGAATVLLKPWRVIPVTGLLLATLKSSQVTGLALSLLARPRPTTMTKDAS
ncbi:MAG: hypothetical protein Q7T87_13040 [Polaromonas sp.]|nr:hypothetical protein [Polaromonas sp.]